MKNPKLLVLVGAPGSGKSTFAKYFVRTEENWVRVCRDDFRMMQFSAENLLPEQEDLITNMIDASIDTLLRRRINVLVDATHTQKFFIEHYITKFNMQADISFKVFDVAVEELKCRVKQREEETGKYIPERVVEKYVRDLEKLKQEFDFSTHHKVFQKSLEYRFQNTELPKAIICDLDGTLALLNGRNPYDASQADKDLLNAPVANILKNYYQSGYKILLVSGRENSYETQTKVFLEKYHIPYNALFMRKANDYRKDSVIKKEIFESEINEKYFIEFVLDDRNQVVDLWRKQLQLPCFQVNYGDF
ncbi:MAG: AAA family ATPase [Bacteroidetes bacterium]|nr:AAA family ATPase [Bacteroidota bacterium]